MSTPEFEVDMDQGSRFLVTINWYGGGNFFAPIEEIDPGYPTKIRVTGHQLPSSSATPVIISGVQGAEILNSRNSAIMMCERVDADYFTVPASTVTCEWIPGTGEITYNLPTDLTNMTARCQIRSKWHAGSFIHEFTTENGGIVLDANDGSIQLEALSAATKDLNFTKAYGDIEVITPGGVVTRVARLIVNFSREMTK